MGSVCFSVNHPLIALTSDLARASSGSAWPFVLGRRGSPVLPSFLSEMATDPLNPLAEDG